MQDEDKRKFTIEIAVSLSEKVALMGAAKTAGVPTSVFVRSSAMRIARLAKERELMRAEAAE
jgi:hypothetical protein